MLLSIINTIHNDELLEEIDETDANHQDSEKQQGQYLIGIAKYSKYDSLLLLSGSVSPFIFFKYDIDDILDYLIMYSWAMYAYRPKTHIMKMNILPNGTYSVILKTHWLRIIQRHWKKTYKQLRDVLRKRGSLLCQQYFSTNGKYPNGLQYLPLCRGMLSMYRKI